MVSKFGDFLLESSKKTYLEYAIDVLKNSEVALTVDKICDEINNSGKILIPKSSYRSVYTIMLSHTKGKENLPSFKSRNKSGKIIFEIESDNPQTFKLVDNIDDVDIDGSKHGEYYLLGAYDGTVGSGQKSELWKQYVDGGYWLNGYAVAGLDKLKDVVTQIPVGANVAIKSSYTKGKINPVIMIKARGIVTKNYGDGTKIDVDWEKGFKPFEIVRSDVGGYRQTLHDISNKKEHIDLVFNSESGSSSIEPEGEEIIKFGPFSGIPTESQDEKETKILEPAERNPFGGESKEAGDEFNSSALFVIGLSGSGKSTRILNLLRENGHKLILIGAENAPSPNLLLDYDQNEGYVPSDIAEFIISAKKDPKHFYTIVFDECHEYIDEIKRSILHAISNKRGEKRFFGVKKSVRHFFEDLETYEITSKVVPDNVGFIFISSKPKVFEYHADFMGRVDKVEVKREDPYPYPDLKYIQNLLNHEDQL